MVIFYHKGWGILEDRIFYKNNFRIVNYFWSRRGIERIVKGCVQENEKIT